MDANVPGAMAILVAPVAAQLSVLLAPEFMPVGFAVKESIAGAEPFSEVELVEPQLVSPTLASRMRTSAQIFSPEKLSPRELNLSLQNKLVEAMCDPPLLPACPLHSSRDHT